MSETTLRSHVGGYRAERRATLQHEPNPLRRTHRRLMAGFLAAVLALYGVIGYGIYIALGTIV
jgi:hypothetical protein